MNVKKKSVPYGQILIHYKYLREEQKLLVNLFIYLLNICSVIIGERNIFHMATLLSFDIGGKYFKNSSCLSFAKYCLMAVPDIFRNTTKIL